VGVETEEPSTRPKVHELAERETQTDTIKRKQSVAGEGPSSKRRRLEAEYPDSACGYTSSANEYNAEPEENEWEVATPSATPQKKELRRIKLRRTGAPRPMQAALRINVPDGARSGFQRAGGFADERDVIARMEARAESLRMMGLQPTIPTPPPTRNIEPPRAEPDASVPSPITVSDDASSGEEYQPPVRQVANPPVAADDTALPNLPARIRFNEVVLLRGGQGDASLIRRTPLVPIQTPNFSFEPEVFARFAADRHVSLEGIDVNELLLELLKRRRVLSGNLNRTDIVWPPLRLPVFRQPSRELIALMTLALHMFGNSELALWLIYCISKYQKATLRKLMSEIFDDLFRL